jgi:hypothetical protein
MVADSRSIIVLLILILTLTPYPGQAFGGMAPSFQFGYGAQVDLNGQHSDMAVELAAGLGLNWISIEFDWARHMPTAETMPDLNRLSAALQRAANSNISVLLILSNPPTWALTAQGPDPRLASALATTLASLQPATVLAIELFPAANTFQGWQAIPDPVAYLAMLKETSQAIQAAGLQAQMIASLAPLAPGHNAADMDDLEFLQGLYQNGAQPYLSVIGLRYPRLVGDPLAEPGQGSSLVLRHYQEVRDLMIQNSHQDGLIWITSFSWPTPDPQQPGLTIPASPQEQAQWLAQALQLLKAQLFIGAAFFNQLNPLELSLWTDNSPSLLLADLSLHPASQELLKFTGATITWLPGVSFSQEQPQATEVGPHLKNLPAKTIHKGASDSTLST